MGFLTESLRKAVPRFWERISGKDEDFGKDLAQAWIREVV